MFQVSSTRFIALAGVTLAALLLSVILFGSQRRDFGVVDHADPAAVPSTRSERAPATVPLTRTPGRAQSWSEQVDSAATWPLPRGNRVAGVVASVLANDPDEWVRSLPAEWQSAAEEFVRRNGAAYAFSDRRVQAWMIDHGFPSLEEFVAFSKQDWGQHCNALRCISPKVAGLMADRMLAELESDLPQWVKDSTKQVDPLHGMSEQEKIEFSRGIVQASSYIRHAKREGAVLYAAYLEERMQRVRGDPERAALVRGFLAACGDPRAPEFAFDEPQRQAGFLVSLLPGELANCDVRPGMPSFPGYG